MQIVIDIPREQYSLIMQSHRTGVARYVDKEGMMYAIKNGIPLPKGHGRLIDADELELDADELELDADWNDYYDGYIAYSESMIKYASTIIEADREVNE